MQETATRTQNLAKFEKLVLPNASYRNYILLDNYNSSYEINSISEKCVFMSKYFNCRILLTE